ncbi:MAG: metalloregulator ArsR/SmtB family transcription factor [Planctomycetota bacterium]
MPTIFHPDIANVPLSTILQALGDPTRLEIVRKAADGACSCGDFCPEASKSRLSHHFRVLREAGIIRVECAGTHRMTSLRREELDQRYPGLLDSILAGDRGGLGGFWLAWMPNFGWSSIAWYPSHMSSAIQFTNTNCSDYESRKTDSSPEPL